MVDGPPGSGRSHPWFLIQHVAREAGIEAVKVDLMAPVLEQQTLPHIARMLVRKMRIARTSSSQRRLPRPRDGCRALGRRDQQRFQPSW
jgi:hypothetical protein